MKDRLLKFMQSKNISAGKLAEMIGVQPSAISHIMSGRNKPGFDFLAGLFNKFPDLNPRWIIIGEGDMILTTDHPHPLNKSIEKENELFEVTNASPDLLNEASPHLDTTQVKTAHADCKRPMSRSKSIERIVIFYTDGTFSPHEQQ